MSNTSFTKNSISVGLAVVVAGLCLSSDAGAQVRERGLNQQPEPANCGRPPIEDEALVKSRFVFRKRSRWKTGQTIRVYFLNGTAEERGVVEHFAREWEKYANISFDFRKERKTKNDHAILIKFQSQRRGVAGWSKLGAGTRSTTRPSMSFKRGIRGSRTVLHEFGHALGLLHEQNNPAGRTNWDLEQAYPYFNQRYGWNRAQFRKKILDRATVQSHNWGRFDPNSVMAYYFPARLFKNRQPFGGKRFLSRLDREGIAKLYPGRKPVAAAPLTLLKFSQTPHRLRLYVRDGHGQAWINNRLVLDQRRSGSERASSKYIDLSKYERGGKLQIRHSFKPLGERAFFLAYVYEGNQRRPLIANYCSKKRPCPNGSMVEYQLTHFSNRNRGGPASRPVVVKDPPGKNGTKKITIDPALNNRIIAAASSGDKNRVLDLLEQGADPNARWSGWTPLMYTATRGHLEAARVLLRFGANPNATISGWTPLRLAQRRGHADLVRLLKPLTGNTNVRSRATLPRTPAPPE